MLEDAALLFCCYYNVIISVSFLLAKRKESALRYCEYSVFCLHLD